MSFTGDGEALRAQALARANEKAGGHLESQPFLDVHRLALASQAA